MVTQTTNYVTGDAAFAVDRGGVSGTMDFNAMTLASVCEVALLLSHASGRL